jgi:leucyl/phenylalanyl-tRNA--protein transferase
MVARLYFPDPEEADEDGVVCAGAEPVPELLRDAYRNGIYPWPHRGQPLLWFCPDPRFVLLPQRIHLHRSLKRAMRRTTLRVTTDTAFAAVLEGCAQSERPGQRGTWITRPMIDGYRALHAEGFAHSVEAWEGDTLVGGLYGVSFGNIFFGESMFARAPDASKIAFATLAAQLVRWQFSLIDCQSHTEHLARFGAEFWPRRRFLDAVAAGQTVPDRAGPWRVDVTPAEAVALLEARGAVAFAGAGLSAAPGDDD